MMCSYVWFLLKKSVHAHIFIRCLVNPNKNGKVIYFLGDFSLNLSLCWLLHNIYIHMCIYVNKCIGFLEPKGTPARNPPMTSCQVGPGHLPFSLMFWWWNHVKSRVLNVCANTLVDERSFFVDKLGRSQKHGVTSYVNPSELHKAFWNCPLLPRHFSKLRIPLGWR